MQADKKKMLILGALLLAMVTIGVFQFSGSSAPAPKKEATTKSGTITEKVTAKVTPPASTTEATTEDPSAAPTLKVASNDAPIAELSERDPFDGHLYDSKPEVKPVPQPPVAKAPRDFNHPPTLDGKLTIDGPLPGPGGVNTQLPGPGVPQVAPVAPPNVFNYTVSGVVTGDRPAAIFVDDKGNQRLVTLGSSIDGDSKLISVARGKVTVRHHGKTEVFSVGANPK